MEDVAVIVARLEAMETKREAAAVLQAEFRAAVFAKLDAMSVDLVETKQQAQKTNGRTTVLEQQAMFSAGQSSGRKGIWVAITTSAALAGTVAGAVALALR